MPPPRDSEIVKALVLVLAFAGWNALSDVIYEALQLDASSRMHPLRITMILVGTLVTCGGIVGLGCVWWARRSLASLGWRAPHPLRLVLFGLATTALLFAGIFGMVALLGGGAGVQAFARAIAHMPAGERLFFTLMGAKVAFAEETLFRGLLQPSLVPKLGAAGAIVTTSVIFALYHRSLTPVPLVLMKMVLGTLLGAAAHTSRSLVPSWMGHWLMWAIAADN
jgi:membrane protease YdiL (CAAX protease family)